MRNLHLNMQISLIILLAVEEKQHIGSPVPGEVSALAVLSPA